MISIKDRIDVAGLPLNDISHEQKCFVSRFCSDKGELPGDHVT